MLIINKGRERERGRGYKVRTNKIERGRGRGRGREDTTTKRREGKTTDKNLKSFGGKFLKKNPPSNL